MIDFWTTMSTAQSSLENELRRLEVAIQSRDTDYVQNDVTNLSFEQFSQTMTPYSEAVAGLQGDGREVPVFKQN